MTKSQLQPVQPDEPKKIEMDEQFQDIFCYNLKRLLRHGYPMGIPLKDLSSLYLRYFKSAVEPKDFLPNCDDWRTVFHQNPLLIQNFMISTVDNISVVKPVERNLTDAAEREGISIFLNLSNYINYLNKKEMERLMAPSVPVPVPGVESNPISEPSSTAHLIPPRNMSQSQIENSNPTPPSPSQLISNNVQNSTSNTVTQHLEIVREFFSTYRTGTQEIRHHLEEAGPDILSNLQTFLTDYMISNSNRGIRRTSSNSNSRGTRGSSSQSRGRGRPRSTRARVETATATASGGVPSESRNGESSAIDPDPDHATNGESSTSTSAVASNLTNLASQEMATAGRSPPGTAIAGPSHNNSQSDTIVESIETVIRSISSESGYSDENISSNPTIKITRKKSKKSSQKVKKFIQNNSEFTKIWKSIKKEMGTVENLSTALIDSEMQETSDWVVFCMCDCKFNTHLGSRGFYKCNEKTDTTRFNGECWESFTSDYYDPESMKYYKTFTLPRKSIVYGEFVRKIGGDVVFCIIDCITWRGVDFRQCGLFARRAYCWEMENWKPFVLPDSWIGIEMMQVVRVGKMEEEFKKIRIHTSDSLALEDYRCFESTALRRSCTLAFHESHETEPTSSMHVDGLIFMKMADHGQPFDFGECAQNTKLLWKFQSDRCISSQSPGGSQEEQVGAPEFGLWTFLEKIRQAKNRSRRH